MQGKIIKGIAGFYYVNVVESGVYECKAKGVFRKEKIKPLVGDNVRIEILDEENKTGNIVEIFPRKNELIRPAVANIDQALVVFAVTKPTPHFNLLDRFLVMMERKEIPVVLCFNKKDIATSPEIAELEAIYEKCGYPIVFTSALGAGEYRRNPSSSAEKDNGDRRTFRSREIVSDQSASESGADGNRNDQQKD